MSEHAKLGEHLIVQRLRRALAGAANEATLKLSEALGEAGQKIDIGQFQLDEIERFLETNRHQRPGPGQLDPRVDFFISTSKSIPNAVDSLSAHVKQALAAAQDAIGTVNDVLLQVIMAVNAPSMVGDVTNETTDNDDDNTAEDSVLTPHGPLAVPSSPPRLRPQQGAAASSSRGVSPPSVPALPPTNMALFTSLEDEVRALSSRLGTTEAALTASREEAYALRNAAVGWAHDSAALRRGATECGLRLRRNRDAFLYQLRRASEKQLASQTFHRLLRWVARRRAESEFDAIYSDLQSTSEAHIAQLQQALADAQHRQDETDLACEQLRLDCQHAHEEVERILGESAQTTQDLNDVIENLHAEVAALRAAQLEHVAEIQRLEQVVEVQQLHLSIEHRESTEFRTWASVALSGSLQLARWATGKALDKANLFTEVVVAEAAQAVDEEAAFAQKLIHDIQHVAELRDQAAEREHASNAFLRWRCVAALRTAARRGHDALVANQLEVQLSALQARIAELTHERDEAVVHQRAAEAHIERLEAALEGAESDARQSDDIRREIAQRAADMEATALHAAQSSKAIEASFDTERKALQQQLHLAADENDNLQQRLKSLLEGDLQRLQDEEHEMRETLLIWVEAMQNELSTNLAQYKTEFDALVHENKWLRSAERIARDAMETPSARSTPRMRSLSITSGMGVPPSVAYLTSPHLAALAGSVPLEQPLSPTDQSTRSILAGSQPVDFFSPLRSSRRRRRSGIGSPQRGVGGGGVTDVPMSAGGDTSGGGGGGGAFGEASGRRAESGRYASEVFTSDVESTTAEGNAAAAAVTIGTETVNNTAVATPIASDKEEYDLLEETTRAFGSPVPPLPASPTPPPSAVEVTHLFNRVMDHLNQLHEVNTAHREALTNELWDYSSAAARASQLSEAALTAMAVELADATASTTAVAAHWWHGLELTRKDIDALLQIKSGICAALGGEIASWVALLSQTLRDVTSADALSRLQLDEATARQGLQVSFLQNAVSYAQTMRYDARLRTERHQALRMTQQQQRAALFDEEATTRSATCSDADGAFIAAVLDHAAALRNHVSEWRRQVSEKGEEVVQASLTNLLHDANLVAVQLHLDEARARNAINQAAHESHLLAALALVTRRTDEVIARRQDELDAAWNERSGAIADAAFAAGVAESLNLVLEREAALRELMEAHHSNMINVFSAEVQHLQLVNGRLTNDTRAVLSEKLEETLRACADVCLNVLGDLDIQWGDFVTETSHRLDEEVLTAQNEVQSLKHDLSKAEHRAEKAEEQTRLLSERLHQSNLEHATVQLTHRENFEARLQEQLSRSEKRLVEVSRQAQIDQRALSRALETSVVARFEQLAEERAAAVEACWSDACCALAVSALGEERDRCAIFQATARDMAARAHELQQDLTLNTVAFSTLSKWRAFAAAKRSRKRADASLQHVAHVCASLMEHVVLCSDLALDEVSTQLSSQVLLTATIKEEASHTAVTLLREELTTLHRREMTSLSNTVEGKFEQLSLHWSTCFDDCLQPKLSLFAEMVQQGHRNATSSIQRNCFLQAETMSRHMATLGDMSFEALLSLDRIAFDSTQRLRDEQLQSTVRKDSKEAVEAVRQQADADRHAAAHACAIAFATMDALTVTTCDAAMDMARVKADYLVTTALQAAVVPFHQMIARDKATTSTMLQLVEQHASAQLDVWTDEFASKVELLTAAYDESNGMMTAKLSRLLDERQRTVAVLPSDHDHQDRVFARSPIPVNPSFPAPTHHHSVPPPPSAHRHLPEPFSRTSSASTSSLRPPEDFNAFSSRIDGLGARANRVTQRTQQLLDQVRDTEQRLTHGVEACSHADCLCNDMEDF